MSRSAELSGLSLQRRLGCTNQEEPCWFIWPTGFLVKPVQGDSCLTNACGLGRSFLESGDQSLIANLYLPAMFLRKFSNGLDLFLPRMARGRPQLRQVIIVNSKGLLLLQCFGNAVPQVVDAFKHSRSVSVRSYESNRKCSEEKEKSGHFRGLQRISISMRRPEVDDELTLLTEFGKTTAICAEISDDPAHPGGTLLRVMARGPKASSAGLWMRTAPSSGPPCRVSRSKLSIEKCCWRRCSLEVQR
jgi:hypothetical protein